MKYVYFLQCKCVGTFAVNAQTKKTAEIRQSTRAIIREAADAMHNLESFVYQDHYNRMVYQRKLYSTLESVHSNQTNLLRLTSNAGDLESYADSYNLFARRFAEEGVFYLPLTAGYQNAAPLMYSCMLSGFAEAHAIFMGERDSAEDVKRLAFSGCKLVSVDGHIPPGIDRRPFLLQAVAETMVAFCIGPLLQRLSDVSSVADANCMFTGKCAMYGKDANEKLDMKCIKASYNTRLKCLRSVCSS